MIQLRDFSALELNHVNGFDWEFVSSFTLKCLSYLSSSTSFGQLGT